MKLQKPSFSNKTSRRSFLVQSGAVAAALTIVPRHVLGADRQQTPNSKLNIGVIGSGGRGADDLQELKSENIVALFDVDWDRAAKTFERFPKAAKYRDFRVMLEKEKGIDAGLDSLLLEMMAMDSEKHARLLQFVQQRLEQRARAADGPSD